MSSKPRILKDYEKLDNKIKEQIKLAYPFGFSRNLLTYKDRENKIISALPFETDDFYYLVRMTDKQAKDIVKDDTDYDDDGILKTSVRDDYMDKYSDLDYMNEYIDEGGAAEEDTSDSDDYDAYKDVEDVADDEDDEE
jgi:hypothetical protein